MAEMRTSLDTFLATLDDLQVLREPLQPHVISQLPDPEKTLYATLLTMLITNQPINDGQVRLFGMLLSSMGLEPDLQPLYANIQNIDKASVLKFCQMCDTHDLAISFLMDALTLCRLDNVLSESQVKSISELINLLRLDATDLADVLHLSNVVLGERVTLTKDTDKQVISHLTKLRLNFDYEKLKPWHEFGYQPIKDESQIKAGLDGGLWLIDKPLSLYSNVVINNATVLFIKQGSLSVDAKDFESVDNNEVIKVSGCQVIGANISILGSTNRNQEVTINNTAFVNAIVSCKNMGILKVENSIFTGDKSHNLSQDYLVLDQVANLDLEGCSFTNCPQTALSLKSTNNSSDYIIKNTLFSHCGDIESDKAGAIDGHQYLSSSDLMIKGCEFVDNRSNQGADFCTSYIDDGQLNIEDSRFINTNTELESSIKSIFIGDHSNSNREKGVLIVNSQFESTSLLIRYYMNWNCSYGYRTFERVTFKNTTVVSNSTKKGIIFHRCVFNNPNKPNLIEYKS